MPEWIVVMAGLMLAAALYYGTWILRREKNIPRTWVVGLALLRILAIMLFILCLLRPAITYRRTVEQSHDVLVMIDTSRSMRQAGAKGEPSRFEAVRTLLQKSPWAVTWLSHFNVYWFAFDREARRVADGAVDSLTPEGEDTRYVASLRDAWNSYRQAKVVEANSTPQANRIILLSDGRDRDTRDPATLARQQGVYLDVVIPPEAQASSPAAEIRIAGVQSPRRVLLGSEARIAVALQQRNASSIPLRVTLAEEGRDRIYRDFKWAAGETERQIILAFQPTSPGFKKYTLRVAPRPTSSAVKAVSPYDVSIKVESRNNEVLFLEDTWRWEFKFLRRIFEKDPHFNFTGFLSRGPGLYMQFGEPDRRVALGGFPQTRTELSWFDTIVIGDVSPQRWPKNLPAALHDLVVEEGKSLIVIAGPNLARLAKIPELESLLPVEITPDSAKPVPGPVLTQISMDGRSSPLFFHPGGADRPNRPELPPLDQIYAPLRKRPAATILLEARERANEYGPLIVAAEHTVGRGRVLFIGTDCLWKWQMIPAPDPDGNTPYGIFWQQALRALQPSRLVSGAVTLDIQPDRSVYSAGQVVHLRYDLQSDQPLDTAVVESTVALPDGRKIPLSLTPAVQAKGRYESEFQVSTSGQYRISAAVMAGGRVTGEAESVIDVRDLESEDTPGPIERMRLEHLASATGGTVIRPEDPGTWPPVAGQEKFKVQQTKTIDLWNRWGLLIAFVVVLGLDWLLRLLRGFV